MTAEKENEKDTSETHCSMTVNGVLFEASGTSEEVARKLQEFMKQVFRPILESQKIVEDKSKESI
jgi:hypothetical protein